MTRPIEYTVRFPQAAAHRVEVEAHLPAGGDAVELMMAVWTPGSYLVREFARNVEEISATAPDGRPLSMVKTKKNRWRVTTDDPAIDEVVVRYRLYAREMSVRTDWVDAGFALLNGAPTFLTLADEDPALARPHRVRLELPAAWERAVSALPAAQGGPAGTFTFVAPDYATLVDSPIYAGSPVVQSFHAGDAEIIVVHEGGGEVWDAERARRDVERIVAEEIAFWGLAPFDRYVFFNLITEAGGGLEHQGSTVLMTSRWKSRTEKGWRDWLSLVSHELFHAWNGKRLRPRALGPFDYESESYTPSLWFVEGVTDYYADLLLRRAGLLDRDDYFARLGKTIEELQDTPGRLVQPLTDASYDAWIKYYRHDENSVNRGVSYYGKGALVAWLLDTRIRQATDGSRSLDDLMHAAWQRWSGELGFTPAELLALVAEVGSPEVADWLDATLHEPRELDYTPALDWFGLRLTEKGKVETGAPAATETASAQQGAHEKESADAKQDEAPAAWLGAGTAVREGRLVVTEVRRGTPAWDAGVNVDDEILAIDDYRVPPAGFDERLKAYRPEAEATLLVARRERLTRLPVRFGKEPTKAFQPTPDPQATPDQTSRRAAWLGEPAG